MFLSHRCARAPALEFLPIVPRNSTDVQVAVMHLNTRRCERRTTPSELTSNGLDCKERTQHRNKTFLCRCLVWKKIHSVHLLLGFKVLVSNTTNMTSLKETKKKTHKAALGGIFLRKAFEMQLSWKHRCETEQTFHSRQIGWGRMVGSFDVIF